MTTTLRHQIRYAASLEDVGAMLDDVAFREAVCAAEGVLRHSAEAVDVPAGLQMTVERVHSTKLMPSVAQKFVGSTITITQQETWTSATHADVRVVVPGQPADVRGTINLSEADGTTTESVALSIRVGVPLVGGKLEAMVADLLKAALDVEQGVGRTWLTG